ncbi:MAG: adenylate/guanylate cyclase domain-containing protein [Cyclobacteriaceae bacterium]|nr:adenylate/guanylate cyclase domain-containing protein [Cyclobacteriaceae bacterium]MDH4297521.1 adenylate/guanylate cyclase domain-containing protein [Cyclobacteriaceae bacterium]MDH5249460.1 adenylate/guanylate cyclase domain-containing protein [Cyclobacteriaceae bacterium]
MFKYARLYARDEGDSPDLAFQKRLLVIISSFLFLCGVAWWLMWYLIFGWSIPTVAAGLFGIMVFVMIIVSHVLKNHYLLAHAVFLGTIIVPVTCQWGIGSMHDSGMIIAWAFLTPLGTLIFLSIRPAIVYMIIFVVCILITALYQPTLYGHPLEVDESIIRLFYSMNLVTSFTVIFSTCAWFVHTIKVEKNISEELLLNILPKDVAEELKVTGDTRAKAFTMVTVMFTDFEGFTSVSKKVSAELLVDEIHHCFSAFDNIIQKYKIEKIKTIGDAYLCASGLPISNYTHAHDMLSAAFEMRDFMLARKKEKEAKGEIPFVLRIGVHTGPVVAGIVGVRKFQYDIWGDTVNTANRVESSGEAGKVNISQSTYELLKDDAAFSFEPRGKIEVKGKVGLEMYFVESVKPQAGGISKAS